MNDVTTSATLPSPNDASKKLTTAMNFVGKKFDDLTARGKAAAQAAFEGNKSSEEIAGAVFNEIRDEMIEEDRITMQQALDLSNTEWLSLRLTKKKALLYAVSQGQRLPYLDKIIKEDETKMVEDEQKFFGGDLPLEDKEPPTESPSKDELVHVPPAGLA